MDTSENTLFLFNLSLLQLAKGDFEAGLKNYERRWQLPALGLTPINTSKPLWLGDVDPVGKTILVHSEQGLGDTIQFLRYVFLMLAIGATVVLAVQEPLVAIVKAMGMPIDVIHAGAPLPEHDMYCPLLSLPLAFGTTVDNIPAVPAYVSIDEGRVATWRTRLGAPRGLRVGLVWSGNARHVSDASRSIAIELLQPLLDLPDVEFFCLQKEINRADLLLARSLDIRSFGSSLVDFQETAALVACMDLVISVDTSIAHLAGAMGKPVWILLASPPDWRWFLERKDSPWYPSVQLYRQAPQRGWSSVLADVATNLSGLAQAWRHPATSACAPAASGSVTPG